MEFNLLTFVFELVNFLILLWLLRRLLYQPVIKVLKERREYIHSRLEKAREKEAELAQLKAEHDALLSEISARKKSELARLTEELEAEKDRRYQALHKELEMAQEKHQRHLERDRREMQSQLKDEAIQLALDFASRFMQEIGDPEIENKLIELTLKTLESLTEEDYQEICTELGQLGEIRLETTQQLSHNRVDQVLQFLQEKLGGQWEIALHFKPELHAGMRIYLGSRVIDSSIQSHLERLGQELESHVQPF